MKTETKIMQPEVLLEEYRRLLREGDMDLRLHTHQSSELYGILDAFLLHHP